MTKSHNSYIVKLFTKAQKVVIQIILYLNTLLIIEQNSNIENLVFYLIKLLNSWDIKRKKENINNSK